MAFSLKIDGQDDISERVEILEAIVDAYGLAETISALSYSEARQFCQEWNATHKPGRLSHKCEFDQQ